jgi:membrane protein
MSSFSVTTLFDAARAEFDCTAEAVKCFVEDRFSTLSAGIAFYAAFSLTPMLVMVIAVAGWFFGPEQIRGQIYQDVHLMIGNDAAAAVQTIVANAHTHSDTGGFAAIASIIALIIGASATFSSLHTALSMIWPTAPSSGGVSSVVALVKVRLVSFGLVLGVAFLAIVSLVLDTVITFIGERLWGSWTYFVVSALMQLGLDFLVLALSFAALLKFLPDARVLWRDAITGGGVAAVLFIAGKKLFAIYLAHASFANAFGAAGSLAALLMWLYFSTAVLLFGAQFAAARGRRRASRKKSTHYVESNAQ